MYNNKIIIYVIAQHYEKKHSSQSMHFDPVQTNSNKNLVVRPIQSDSDLKSSVLGFERYSDGSINYNNCENSSTSSDNSVIATSSPVINNMSNNIENNNIYSDNSNNNEMNDNNKNIIHQRNQSQPITISEMLEESSLPRVKSQKEQQQQQNKEENENDNTINKSSRGRFYSTPNVSNINSVTPKQSSKTPNNKSPSKFPISVINNEEVSHSMNSLLELSSSDNRNENSENINKSSEDVTPRNEDFSTCSLTELGSNLLRKIEETKDQEPGEYLESLDKIQDDIAESSSHSVPISPLNTSSSNSNIIQQKQPQLETIPHINSDDNNFTLSCLEESIACLSKEVSEMRERLNILNENMKCNQIPNQFNTILTITNFVILFLFTVISYFFK